MSNPVVNFPTARITAIIALAVAAVILSIVFAVFNYENNRNQRSAEVCQTALQTGNPLICTKPDWH